MKCGAEILVRDLNGSNVVRFIAQCEDRYLLISYGADWRNGYMLAGWREVLRELVAKTVPAKLREHRLDVQSAGSGTYTAFGLAYPLSAKSFADLFGVTADEVRTELSDLAVDVAPLWPAVIPTGTPPTPGPATLWAATTGPSTPGA